MNDTAYLFPSNENDMDGEIEDLLAYFHQQLTLQDNSLKICVPEVEMTQMHISGRVSAIVRKEQSPHPITLKLCWQLSCYHSGLLRCTSIQCFNPSGILVRIGTTQLTTVWENIGFALLN